MKNSINAVMQFKPKTIQGTILGRKMRLEAMRHECKSLNLASFVDTYTRGGWMSFDYSYCTSKRQET